MPIFEITGATSDDATIYVIDEDTDVLEAYQYFVAGGYEISHLSDGTKLVVATTSNGLSLAYGGITPTPSPGDGASTGLDGPLIVDSGDVVVNDYTNITAMGANNITVDSSSAFAEGDEVFIIQSQSTGGTVGTWETKRITNINSNLITFTESIENSYSTSGSDVIQAIRVPNYTNVDVSVGNNIICPAWNGSVGGVIFFRAQGIVTLEGGVNVNSKGFRVGPGKGGNTTQYGWSGESTQSNSYAITSGPSAVPLGGGGGGWCGQASQSTPAGGAGGGHAVAGDAGRKNGVPQAPGANAVGGSSYGVANLDSIYFGSSGGNAHQDPPGNGGGIIIISSEVLNVAATGSITADGSTSWGYGGSGAGGSLFLQVTVLDINTNLISAAGGAQTTYGGAAGDGRIRLDYTTINGSTNNPTPGYIGSY